MNDFIQMAMKQMGTTESTTRSLTGSLLGFIKDKASGPDVSQLMEKLPGAAGLVEEAAGEQAAGGQGGGLLGGLAGKVGAQLGGSLGSSAGLLGLLGKSGLGTDKIGSFVSMFVGFIKDKAGADLVGRILGQVPELKKMGN